MIAMRKPDDACYFCGQVHPPVELDEFTQRRYARMSMGEMWGEFQGAIAEYNERNAPVE